MAKEMLVNVSEGEECRIALLDHGKLEELYMERTSSTSHVGNIYKGRVTNVEPSIQAAFVDFGLGRNGFLHISDLMPTYFGRAGDDIQESVGRKMARRDRPPIQRCLRRGDEIIVQIIKEGIGTKGPTLSTYLSIPGRILVMMPGMSKFGISRKIEDEDERKRLRGILDGLKPIQDVGFIIRTAGVGKTKTEIQRDLTYLTRLWQNINKKMKEKAPVELYTEGDLVARTVRDVFTTDVDRIVVDSPDVSKKIKDFIKILMPRTKNKVELYEEPVPIFHKYGIEKEIELMYSRHVPLPSGGSLVIDSTEAIVAIDVNSGKFREHADAETTAFKTDMEAADEIPRQLRLRDLGGVIICDFIDLRFERHRRELEKRLHDNLKNDRAKTKVLRMSQFGIIEMTRQRMRPSLKRSIYFDCPHCKGAGLVKTPESMSLDVMRRLAIAANDLKVARIELSVCPDVGYYLLNKKRASLAKLEANAKKRIIVRQDPTLGLDEMKLELYDLRDGLVFLDELGMRPTEQQGLPGHRTQQQHGRRDDRRGGRHPQGRHDHRRDQRREEPPELDEERLEIRGGMEESEEPRESRAQRDEPREPREAGASKTPSGARSAPREEEPERESEVVDLDDAPEPMGEGPRAFDDRGDNGGRRGRRRRRGRRGRGRGNQQQQPHPQPAHADESDESAKEVVEESPAESTADQMQEAIDEADEPSPGNEREPQQEGDQPRKRRRRRGGRRHRRRRERAEAAAGGGNSESNGNAAEESDASDEVQDREEAGPEAERESEPARRPAPQRIPPPPVVRTGSTDRHIVDDEPIHAPPPSRPRSYRDLDALPDDLD
jgi:ribonuclease E